jgi:hypothetical protein
MILPGTPKHITTSKLAMNNPAPLRCGDFVIK